MDNISHMTFSNVFYSMQMFEFRWEFHWSLFLKIHLIISQQWFRNGFGADQATSHYLNQWRLVCRSLYASLGLNELNKPVAYHNRQVVFKYGNLVLEYLFNLDTFSTNVYFPNVKFKSSINSQIIYRNHIRYQVHLQHLQHIFIHGKRTRI